MSQAGGSKEGSKPRKGLRKKQQNNDEDCGGTENKKKPFDKAKWREKQYSNKFKVSQWQERRKKTVLHEYHKILLKDGKTAHTAHTAHTGARFKKDQPAHDTTYNSSNSQLVKAQEAYRQKKEAKRQFFEKIEQDKAERAEALARYKARKTERFKKLSCKTKYGQPLMRGRMQLMLADIEKMVKRE